LRKEGYAPATVNKRLVILRHMLKKAVDWQMLALFVLERAFRSSSSGNICPYEHEQHVWLFYISPN
jgi:hypothetical protein